MTSPRCLSAFLAPSALLCALIASPSAKAATTTFDFSGTQYATNFTETANGARLSVNTGINNGVLEMSNVSSLAGVATYNTAFPSSNTASFNLKIDGSFSTMPTTFGGDSIGFMTNVNGSGVGYMAIFRIRTSSGASEADFRLFEAVKTDGTTTPLVQVGSTIVLNSAALGGTVFTSSTFYTFGLQVDPNSGNGSISFTGSIFNASNGNTIGSFGAINDASAIFGGTTVGLRLGTQGNVNNFTRADNFTLTTVPEPSAFAVLGGVAALGFAALRRRRRA